MHFPFNNLGRYRLAASKRRQFFIRSVKRRTTPAHADQPAYCGFFSRLSFLGIFTMTDVSTVSNANANPSTNPITQATAATIAAQYLAAWNEQDTTARRALVACAFSSNATYIDPVTASQSHDGIDTMIDAAQKQFVGMRFTLHGQPDGHHNIARFSWALGVPQAAPVAIGTDVVVVGDDGLIRSVTGFLDARG
jgi:SnoaL-like domain